MGNRVLVIGNGFDIAHGMKTKYQDFLYVVNKKIGIEYMYDVEQKYRKELDEVARSFILDETMINLIKNNIWIKYFNRLKIEGQNWIDFEREIKNVCTSIHNKKGNIKLIFESDSCSIETMKKDLNELIYIFNVYLCSICNNDLNKQSRYRQLIDFAPTRVISFNYTNTYEYYDSKMVVEHVHGKINNDSKQNTIVLGFDTLGNDNADIEFAEFVKYVQMTKNDINLDMDFQEDLYGLDVLVFGHSFDKTDIDILKPLVEKAHNVTLIYNNESHKMQMIKNLINIFGREDYFELCFNKSKKIHFVKQEKPALFKFLSYSDISKSTIDELLLYCEKIEDYHLSWYLFDLLSNKIIDHFQKNSFKMQDGKAITNLINAYNKISEKYNKKDDYLEQRLLELGNNFDNYFNAYKFIFSKQKRKL